MAVHSQVNGTTALPWRGSRRRPSLLEQLRGCRAAWCPAAPWDRGEARAAVCGRPAGSFLVVCDRLTSQPSLLCVSAEGDNETVLDYKIKSTGTVFQLADSRLSFSDLAQLVLFYSLTRDVLAACLCIPRWIFSMNDENKHRLSQLEPEAWLASPPDPQTEEMTQREASSLMCSIQLTSTNGALCIINPLYVHEQGDDWLTHGEGTAQCARQPSNFRKARRLSTTRSWAGAGMRYKRAISLDQNTRASSMDYSGQAEAESADGPPTTPTPAGVVLRRPSRDSTLSPPHGASAGRPPSPVPSATESDAASELQRHGSPVCQSPHRVSWIEDGVWLPPPRPPANLGPPYHEQDSLSISSIEEEQESPVLGPATFHHPSAHRLADKVIHRLSAVGQVLGGLVCQKKRLTNRVKELSERRGTVFAEAVKGFVETTQKGGPDDDGVTGSEFLQEVRSSLSSLRETLLGFAEIQALLDSITDLTDPEIDSLVELALHKVALRPVSAHLYSCVHDARTHDGTLDRLQSNLPVLEKKEVEELGGSPGVGVPDSVGLERIQQRWTAMHKAYSPNKKVQILLKICKSIYHSMSANGSLGTVFGADDFLPCLTWVLLRSDMVTLQLDTDYMMELLDPTQLQGEGGYYLTTLYASLYYISSFRPRLAARQLSMEAQHSLNQWHRRRTLHCNQSRRSQHRRTIRRQMCREKNSETETANGENDLARPDESQQQRESGAEALQPLSVETETDRGGEDRSQASDQQEVTQEVTQTLCTAADGEEQRGS